MNLTTKEVLHAGSLDTPVFISDTEINMSNAAHATIKFGAYHGYTISYDKYGNPSQHEEHKIMGYYTEQYISWTTFKYKSAITGIEYTIHQLK